MADNLIVRFFGDTGPLRRSLEAAGAEAEAAGSRFGRVGAIMGKGLKVAAIGTGVAVAGVGLALYESVKAAEESQVQVAKLRRSVANAGVSWKRWGGQIKETEDRLAAQSGFLQTDMYSSMSQLITTTGQAASATKLQGIAMNLARARGLSLAQTSTILSKVWNGNTTSLVRLGISLSKVTTNQDALKAKTGTATAAQVAAAKAADLVATRQAALAALQQKFGGQWKAYGDTAAGAQARFGVAVHELEVAIGKAFLPAVSAAFGALANWTNELSHSKTAADAAHGVMTFLGQAMKALGNVIGAVAGFIRAHWTEIRNAVHSAVEFIVTQVIPRAIALFNFLKTVTANLARGFMQSWPQMRSAIVSMWNAVKPLLSALGRLLSEVIGPAILWISKHSGKAFSILSEAIKLAAKIITPILSAIASALNDIISSMKWVTDHLGAVKGFLDSSGLGGGPGWLDAGGKGNVNPVTGKPINSVARRGMVGAVTVVHVHVAGSVVTHQDLVKGVRDGLVQLGRAQRGAAGVFGGYA